MGGLRTTTVGSYPMGGLDPAQATARAVRAQVAAGIDLITTGQAGLDMIARVAQHLTGVTAKAAADFDRLNQTTALHPTDRRKAVVNKETIKAADWQGLWVDYRRALAYAEGHPVKAVLTGPTTLAHCLAPVLGSPYDRSGVSRRVADLAAALRPAVEAALALGARHVQVDEPMLGLPGVDVGLALRVLRPLLAGVETPWLHTCGDVRPIWGDLLRAPVAVIHVAGSDPARRPLIRTGELAAAGMSLGWGVIPTSGGRLPSRAAVAAAVEAGLRAAGPERLWLSPDCGLRLHTPQRARRVLQQLAQAARSGAG